MTLSRHVAVAGSLAMFGIWACGGRPAADSVERNLFVEPAEPLEVFPAGAERLRISGTTNNNQPVAATNPEFSAELCDRLRAAQPSLTLGEVRSQLTSNATVNGTHIGEATMHAEACLFGGPPPTVVASLAITASDGDVLYLTIRASRTPESPPPPDSEDKGGGTITGGTGRFAGASGDFNLSAKSHGDLLPGTNVATERDIDINGYINLRTDNER